MEIYTRQHLKRIIKMINFSAIYNEKQVKVTLKDINHDVFCCTSSHMEFDKSNSVEGI